MKQASKRNFLVGCRLSGKQSLVLGLVVLMVSCNQQPAGEKEEESDLITVTEQQFTSNSMKLAPMRVQVMDSVVHCSGQLIPVKGGQVNLGVPLSGIVKSVYVQEGQRVEKGQLVAEVGGNEMIELQREFAVSSAEYDRLESEHIRIKQLYEQNAVSEKDFKSVLSAYKTALASYKSLKLRIEQLGLSASRIEAGEFYGVYPVRANLTGQLTNLVVKPGARVETSVSIAEIVNSAKLQLKMSVYESDASLVEIGQRVEFGNSSDTKVLSAQVSRIAAGLSEPARTLEVYADITTPGSMLVNQMVSCKLIVKRDSVNAVPVEAVGKTETGMVLLVVDKKEKDTYYFKKCDIQTGRQQDGFFEVKSPFVTGEILVKGVYTIQL